MRRMCLLLSMVAFWHASAQEVTPSPPTPEGQAVTSGVTAPTATYSGDMGYAPDMRVSLGEPPLPALYDDTLHLPVLTHDGRLATIGRMPTYWGGWDTWSLHRGLNVSLGASVFAQFGKHARHGAGFAQSLSAMYAMPLTDKLSVAVGGYINNVYWSHDAYRDAGVSAMLGYRFDEHWEAYLYGQKSVAGSKWIPRPLYDLGELRDRIGAAVRYNFSPSFSVQVSVEKGER